MLEPDVPNDEESRLKTLRSMNILDSTTQEQFDRLTRIACQVFDVSISLVSLIDSNRQWFKSHTGLDVRETGRDISFCGHAILNDQIFYIEDASKDSRFSDNPLVTGPPHIRFYAGRPIKAPNGHNLGTLCIIDDKPKHMTKEDFRALDDLADTVEQELAALQLVTIDELTKLSSLRGFYQLAAHCLAMAQRQKVPVTLICFDIDNFEAINNKIGFSEGDRILKIFADQLRETFRSSDLFCRIRNDEFATLLFNADEAKAKELVTRFQNDLTHQFKEFEANNRLSFSCSMLKFDAIAHPTIQSFVQAAEAVAKKSP